MVFCSLNQYARQADWPPALAETLTRRGLAGGWTPLQRAALADGLPAAPDDWLVAAPAGAGKTLVAELAAFHHLARGEKVWWLVPTRALADHLARTLTPTLAAGGWRAVCSSAEHTDADAAVDRGEYDLLVVVYEKALARLTARPDALAGVGLIVADELGMLRDPERGPRLDLLLTLAQHSPYVPRRLGLAPPLPDTARLADWWGGRLLSAGTRPAPLREGALLLASGRFLYRGPGGEPAEEPLALPPEWAVWLARAAAALEGVQSTPALAGTLAAAALLAARGEPTLLFAPTRGAARSWAAALARISHEVRPTPGPGPCAQAAERLARREPGHDHARLAEWLAAGVAVHHADLSPEGRALAERAFAAEALLAVATGTLAQGVNLRAVNAVQWASVFTGASGGEGGRPLRPAPLERWRWLQQGGRAGRLGVGDAPGRTLLVARDEAEAERLLRRYAGARPEPLRTGWRAADAGLAVTAALAGGEAARTRENLAGLLAATWAGHCAGPGGRRRLDLLLTEALTLAQGAGMLGAGEGMLRLAGRGRIGGAHGLDPLTLRRLLPLLEYPALPAGEGGERLAIFGLALAAPVGYWPAAPEGEWPRALAEARAWADGEEAMPAPLRALLGQADPHPREAAALAAARRLAVWIGPWPTPEVEARTGWTAGMLARAGEGVAWLAGALAALGRAEGWTRAREGVWRDLGTRLATGAPAAAASLARRRWPELGRAALMRLAAEGIDTPEAVAEAEFGLLTRCIGEAEPARRVQTRARGGEGWEDDPARPAGPVRDAPLPAARPEPDPLLEIDLTSPGVVRADGRELRLPPLLFDLLAMLAESPGRVVTRAALYQRLWPEGGPEDQQLDAHRRRLARLLGGPGLLEVVRGIGFRLTLAPGQVRLSRG